MAINGVYNYNNYNMGKINYAAREEYEKEQAFLKENNLNGDLVDKGRAIERADKMSGRSSMPGAYDYENHKNVSIPIDGEYGAYRIVSANSDEGKAHIAKLIQERDNAIAEYAKYKELKAAAEPAKAEKSGHGHGHGHAQAHGKGKHDVVSFDMDKIREMKSDMSKNLGAYKKMVFNQAKTQGKHAETSLQKMLSDVAGMSQADAAKAVADDGEWGVEATANRILDFAKAISGGDPSKIATLKDAVQKGFAAAGKVWGGSLPEISHQTLARIMEGFDEWENAGKADTVIE